MKQKLTYIIQNLDQIIASMLLHSKDINSQIEFLKNKEKIITDIDKYCETIDEIIQKLEKNNEI